MHSVADQLEQYQCRRRFSNWQPKPSYYPYVDQGTYVDSIIQRILEFVDLEVSVGAWIQESLSCLSTVERDRAAHFVDRNAQDEQKHDQQLRYLREHIGFGDVSAEASSLINQWNAQQPSFALAYALEMGIFMTILPWLTKHGDMYSAQCSQWISDDEVVHVLTNRALSKACLQELSKEHLTLVVATLLYIFEGTEANELCRRAYTRLTTGADKAMMDESVPLSYAFFEQTNVVQY